MNPPNFSLKPYEKLRQEDQEFKSSKTLTQNKRNLTYDVSVYIPTSQMSKTWHKTKDLTKGIRKKQTQNLSQLCLVSSLNHCAVCHSHCRFRKPFCRSRI